jgi:hypothetical protein
MNRRDFLTQGAAALAASRSGFGDEPASRVRVTIHPDKRIHTIAPDFMGLGYEISSVSRPGLLSSRNRVYVQLVRTLGARGVIRIGGNTSDYSAYSPAGQPVSSAKGTVVNDAVLRDLGGFLEANGWRLIWGLNLGQGSVGDAVAEAKAVLDAAGKQLLAFEIGNEPDLFPNAKHRQPGYGYDEWLAEYRRYKAALRERFPRIPFAGPDAAVKTDWVTRFAADEGKDAVLLTHHYYREGQNPTSTIEKLLAPDPKLQPQLEKLSAASRACGLPYRICEVNSFSGGGRPGVSDTFAGALWALDYLFTLAANGCSGVNMETGVNHRDFISSYSPIGDDERGHYSAKPEYYGLLAFSLAGRGSLLMTEVEGGSPEVKAYATQSGRAGLALTLINKGADARTVTVSPGGAIRKASVIRLHAPALSAKEGVTLGGAELTSAGAWRAAEAGALQARNGEVSLDLPAASAAIVRMD